MNPALYFLTLSALGIALVVLLELRQYGRLQLARHPVRSGLRLLGLVWLALVSAAHSTNEADE